MIQFGIMFLAKVVDNILNTTKAIFIQRNKAIFAGISLALSTFIGYYITKIVVQSDGLVPNIVASVAAGVGCIVAVSISNKLSKDRLYVNVLMCDNIYAMRELHDMLSKKHITNVVTDTYTKDFKSKTITITAYCETKEQSKILDEYIASMNKKLKRVIQKV